MKETLKHAKDKMNKSIDVLEHEYQSLRAGRASPALLERINVDYYGAPTPLNQMAAISVPEPRTIVVAPWDTSSLTLIEKAISASDLGINPQNDGKIIRLNFPQPSEERRKELVHDVHKLAENAKVAVRAIRRECNDKLKAMNKAKEITEDDLSDSEKDVQNMTDKFCKTIDEISAKKEKEILEV